MAHYPAVRKTWQPWRYVLLTGSPLTQQLSTAGKIHHIKTVQSRSRPFVRMQSAKATLKQVRREAEQCMSVGDYVGAFVRWSHAIAGSPAQDDTYAHALAQRSRCLLKIGNHYYALQDARRAAELDPDATQGYQRLAEVYFSVSFSQKWQ